MSAARAPVIAITAGEPAGIGPDLCALLAAAPPPGARIVLVADPLLLARRAALLGLPWNAPAFDTAGDVPCSVWPVPSPSAADALPGRLDPGLAAYVLDTLRAAADGCLQGRFDAMATGPVHKGVINDAGYAFTGHTEFLAEYTQAPHPVMMLAGGGMRVALATTHLAVRDVAAHITAESLERTLRVLHHDLRTRFGLESPRIAVAGLNPHAGESGHLGREEVDIIAPLLERLRGEGWRLEGPLPADTLFQRERLAGWDCVLAMYHDQGLPVLKYASFGHGVNITLGLPLIRTSVDHGTALELAGSGRADAGSLYAAVATAAALARSAAA